MDRLGELLAEAAKTGRLTALTIWPAGSGWQCNARRKLADGSEGWTCVTTQDPVAGTIEALTGAFTALQQPPAPPAEAEEDIFG